jgi:hypothetical protein
MQNNKILNSTLDISNEFSQNKFFYQDKLQNTHTDHMKVKLKNLSV